MSTVRFLDEGEIERLAQSALLREYIAAKREEIGAHNTEAGRDPEIDADVRRLTNLGTFRAYVEHYLRSHPKIHQDMTLMVRQLAPTPTGIPVQIYCFTNTTDWGAYEAIQADLFDHLLSIAPAFGLRPFQSPTGTDLTRLAQSATN
jgi:miniconductance mechanosensitive channel